MDRQVQEVRQETQDRPVDRQVQEVRQEAQDRPVDRACPRGETGGLGHAGGQAGPGGEI